MLIKTRHTGYKNHAPILLLLLLGAFSFALAGCAGLASTSSNSAPTPTALTISNVTATSATMTGFQVAWSTSLAATSQVNYGKTTSYGSTAGSSSTLTSTHQASLANLVPGTTYHFQVQSTDSSGTAVTSNDMTFATLADATPPTVAIASPVAGATISGSAFVVSATATDTLGIASVQFKVDGANTGSLVTAAPYNYPLNTTTLSNGNHTLTAVATDPYGVSATSAAVTVAVNNTTKDTTPPTVSITGPANGATVSGTVAVTATAADNVAVASVQFQLDGGNVGSLDTTAPYSFSWNTATSANGSHTLKAIATDTSGNSTASVGVTVTVNNSGNTTPPTVSITAPANGATVSGTVSVTATASDNVGVASVQFQLDGANVGSLDTTAPYSFSWNTTTSTSGSHKLTAVAKDTAGNSATSAVVTVTVSNTDTTPPTVPTGLTATAISSSQVNLSWTASTDNVGVTGYNVYRGGTKVGTSVTNAYSDTGLAASTSYTYTVSAFDAAGNTSAQSSGASATTTAAGTTGGIPSALGWYQIPNTLIQPNCPNETTYSIGGNCSAVVAAWSGAIADTKRNRLVVWGGGHTDYSGNELYALDLNALTMSRLNNPTTNPPNSCVAANSDGTPLSRHTYDGMAYLPNTDELFAFNGSLACDIGATAAPPDSWTNTLANLQWTQQQYSGTSPGNAGGGTGFGDTADYDPNTGLVFATDPTGLFSYNRTTNAWTSLSKYSHDYHMTAVVDPGRQLFILFGGTAAGDAGGPGGIQVVNIASGTNYSFSDWNSQVTGCSALQNTNYPGLAYDSVQKLIVGWAGGDTVYLFNPDTKTCTSQTYTGGPGNAQTNGTFGRFRYFPALNLFAVVNDYAENGYTLRLTAAPGGAPSTGPAITSISVTGISTTAATVSWNTDVASTSQVRYGTTTSYGSSSTLNSSLVTSHSVALSGLTANTVYHYAVLSTNSGGVQSVSGDSVFSTSSGTDTTPPTVSLTAPAANATVSGTVTVSANASDNVGVTSVQFLLDGANLGSALTTAPYSISWDTTAVSNGSHVLSARASDAAGNIGNATGVTVTVSNSGSPAANSFATRCAATGVILCNALDSSTNIGTIQPDCHGVIQGSLDTTVAGFEGNGALKFNVPANASCANMSGFTDYGFGQLFSQNSDFYVQYRWRADSNYLGSTFNSAEGFKHSITYMGGQSTCAQVEITLVNGENRGYPQAYTDCGANGFCIAFQTGSGCALEGNTSLPTNDFLYEEASSLLAANYNCYRNAPPAGVPTGCANYVANNWMTFYFHVHVGTYGNANSTVEMWVAFEGQPLQQFINMPNITLQNNSLNTDGFSAIELTDYNTDTAASTNPQGTVWYNSLIVSTQPIPAPNGPTP